MALEKNLESKKTLIKKPFTDTDSPTTFQAIGIIRGQYFPSQDNPREGIVVTESGTTLSAHLRQSAQKQCAGHPEKITESQVWSCYPRQIEEAPWLKLTLKNIRSPQTIREHINFFLIRGVIVNQDLTANTFEIEIRRNLQPSKNGKQWNKFKPFTLNIVGSLPSDSINQFWELACSLDGYNLVLEDSHLVSANFVESDDVALPEPTSTPTPKAPLVKQANSSVKKDRLTIQAHTPKNIDLGDSEMTTAGKLELTIKINSFPEDVRTVENGWKHFELDCDGVIASITVKPKIFKKLEDAVANYPMWVAAIAGKMGSRTKDGFVLENASITTFERKPKESSQESVTTKV
ncbi:hypothetical protein Cri9333_0633 [Crinalium epipsammum PCC 9333]|uniref:Fertility inhibition FinO-like protein n=1 Tax=Crinalium epipsammum PCC 9333 TaxID=1173022 RepID=K9VUG6_9CYAN|nr:hypothetical protein [Crinalium epipsammum]AFZ11576.1 hypothetical protein Cri9333_0633 [Crinalium epipsammum PCC 9333]